ncbi:hypothetical protein LshimejAT787_0600080 [Lyophyllum shimeji]|uniref:Uncharacterized protein n=1 Tax=Lyophyllum shimeji TaxID=47721 RepID=A0A9P3UQ35_LYOSH|nr:hypothetical protein LshimejAT787_0600080 [Lyophyllum shimeji]
MVNWSSPEVIAANAVSFDKFVHVLLGVYIWEWFTSLNFDLTFVTGERKFKWPMFFYFYGRYAMLGGLIGFVIVLDSTKEIACQAAYTTLQVLGNTALGVASINLAIRTSAVWGKKNYVRIPMLVLLLGQFGIILRSVFNAESVWVEGMGCVTSNVQSKVFAAMYIYTMAFDFLILLLTAYKLWFANRSQHRSRIVRLLFQDGLVYFVVAFVGNLIAVIFSLLDLNPVMNLIADIPATTFATIVSGRVVRRLSDYLHGGPEVYTTSSRTRATTANTPATTKGVRVEMTTFTDNPDPQVPVRDNKVPEDVEAGMLVGQDYKHHAY